MRHKLPSFNRAQVPVERSVSVIVAVLVASLLAAFLLPMVIGEIAAVDTSGWESSAASLWNLLDVLVVMAILLFFVRVAINSR